MLRALIVGLTILHLGPGLAFALLAFGCEGSDPLLASVCGKGEFAAFGTLTLVGWGLLLAGFGAAHLVQRARGAGAGSTGPRVVALLAVLVLGVLLGAAGTWLTGSSFAWLAVPLTLAVAWWFLANPLACSTGSA